MWRSAGNSRGGPQRRGFSLLELMVVVAAFGIIAALLLHRLHEYEARAEEAAVHATLRLFGAGLQLRLAELIVKNREAEAGQLERENPAAWLDARPENYGGDYPAQPRTGYWYFDTAKRQLVYLPVAAFALTESDGKPLKEIRFYVKVWADRSASAQSMGGRVRGVSLLPAVPYRWR